MRDLAGLIFDKDGTLFDFHATWAGWTRRMIDDLAGGGPERARRIAAQLGYDLATGQFDPGSPVIAGTPGEIAQALEGLVAGHSHARLIALMNTAAAAAPQGEVVALVPVLGRLEAAGRVVGGGPNDAEA
ncbi:MAG: HAD family hydrolase, partial [Rhodobacteraceae bacterium]|nr:HAD family hydrolase [Paracoccaceae bacterium]